MKARLTRHALLAALVMAGARAPARQRRQGDTYARRLSGTRRQDLRRLVPPHAGARPLQQPLERVVVRWRALAALPSDDLHLPADGRSAGTDRDARPAARSAKLVLLRQHPVLLPMRKTAQKAGARFPLPHPAARRPPRRADRTGITADSARGYYPYVQRCPETGAPLRRHRPPPHRHLKESASHEKRPSR